MFDFKILRLMASIFTPDFSIGNTLKLVNEFQEITGEKFNGELISMPLPQGAPPELPRLVLNSIEGVWHLEISLARTNLIFMKPLNLVVEVPNVNDFGGFANNFFTMYKKRSNIKIQRFGLVAERLCISNETNPSHIITQRFCKKELLERTFKNLDDIEINSFKKYQYEGFNINSSVKIKTAKLADELKTPIIVVTSDLNTFSEEDNDFGENEISRFFENVPNHLTNILELFF